MQWRIYQPTLWPSVTSQLYPKGNEPKSVRTTQHTQQRVKLITQQDNTTEDYLMFHALRFTGFYRVPKWFRRLRTHQTKSKPLFDRLNVAQQESEQTFVSNVSARNNQTARNEIAWHGALSSMATESSFPGHPFFLPHPRPPRYSLNLVKLFPLRWRKRRSSVAFIVSYCRRATVLISQNDVLVLKTDLKWSRSTW